MSRKKRHHYVPKFYLKRFSNNGNGKFIGLFNHKNNLIIQSAALRHQAYEDSLYGNDDEIENALASMEQKIVRMFYYWTKERLFYPPPEDSNGFQLLKQFILYQAFRTPKSGDDITEKINEGMKVFVREFKPEIWESIKNCYLKHPNPTLLSLINSAKHEHLLGFMRCRFLINLTELPFVTSDSPVVFYNQLMEAAGNYMGATALVAKGLQIFYPIDPRMMICLFDPEVYDFGGNAKNCFGTESIDDVHQLNALQLINSNTQIFFNDQVLESYISSLNDKFRDDIAKTRNINKKIEYDDRQFFLMGSEDRQIDLSLGFFKFKINPENFRGSLTPLRHISFTES